MKSHYLLISLLALNGCSHLRQANTSDLELLEDSLKFKESIGRVLTERIIEQRKVKLRDNQFEREYYLDLDVEPIDIRPVADYSILPVHLTYVDSVYGDQTLFVDVKFLGENNCNATYWGLLNRPEFELIWLDGTCDSWAGADSVENLVTNAVVKSLE
ncbi:MAG: hypothetical protein ABIJ18_03840 [archaeon]